MSGVQPSGERPLDAMNFALKAAAIIQRCEGAEIRWIQQNPNACGTAIIYITSQNPLPPEALSDLSAAIARETNWSVNIKLSSGAESKSDDTITGARVIDSSWSDSRLPAEEVEVIEGEVVDAGEMETLPVLAGRQGQSRFGLVRVAENKEAVRALVSGNTANMASQMMGDEALKRALASTSAFRGAGEEGVENAIRKVQKARPVGDAVDAAGTLSWAVEELLRSQGTIEQRHEAGRHLLCVAYMILGAAARNDNHKDLLSIYVELISSVDRTLGKDLERLCSDNPATAKDAFQTVFAKLLQGTKSLAAPPPPSAEEPAPRGDETVLILGSLILRHLTIVFQDPARRELRRLISERFAEEIHKELVETAGEKRAFMGLLLCCHEVAFDFFHAVLTHFVGESEQRDFSKDQPQMRGDAVECLLACACIGWPRRFYEELNQRYAHSSPALQTCFLSAMKFAVGDDPERQAQIAERALALLNQERPEVKVLASAVSLLQYFADPLAAAVSRDNFDGWRRLSPKQRQILIHDVLIPSCDYPARFPDGRAKVLPLLLFELAGGNGELLNRSVLTKLLSNDFLKSLDENIARSVWQPLLQHYGSYRDRADRNEVKRVLRNFGFAAIRDAFETALKVAMVNPPLFQELLLLTAEVTAGYRPAQPAQTEAICKFVRDTVVPRFLSASRAKFEAMGASDDIEKEKTGNLNEMVRLKKKTAGLQLAVARITGHPGFIKKCERVDTLELKINELSVDPEGNKDRIAAMRERQANMLAETLEKVEESPGWTEQFQKLTIKQMREIVAEFESWRRQVAELGRALESIGGGQDRWMSVDGSQTFHSQEEAMAAASQGTAVRWVQVKGSAEEGDAAVKQHVDLVAAEAQILRLFLQSPAIDEASAREIFDQLNPLESQAALCRFTLSLRYTFTSAKAEGAETEEDPAAASYREVMLSEAGVDIGESTEPEESEDAYDAEVELQEVFKKMILSPGHRDDIVEFLDSLRQLVEKGKFIPSAAPDHPLMCAIGEQMAAQIKGGFKTPPDKGWSDEANGKVLTLLWEGYQKLAVEEIDRPLRAVLLTWLKNWEPPRELPGLASADALQILNDYVPRASGKDRKLEMIYRLARLANDRYASFPHSGTGPKVLETLINMRANLTEVELRSKIQTDPSKPIERLGIVLEGAIDALQNRFSRYSGSPAAKGRPGQNLALPFETNRGWSGLVLPRLPETGEQAV